MEPNPQQSKVTTELMAETASKYGLCVCMNPTIVSISVHHDSVNLGPRLGLSGRAANCYDDFKLACHLAIYMHFEAGTTQNRSRRSQIHQIPHERTIMKYAPLIAAALLIVLSCGIWCI